MTATATQLAAELRLTVSRLNRRLQVRTASGLTPSQASLIATLARSGPLHLGELARCEAVSPPTASRAVDRLIQLGLVQRTCDTDDARKHTVTLTQQGRATAARRDDAATVLISAALRNRSAEQTATLRRALPLLQAIIDDLSDGRQGP